MGCGRRGPGGALGRCPNALGDTFVVDSGDDRYLFVFSPVGVAAFYALPEEKASKGVADWRMLRRKLPDEVFDGRRVLPHQLFGREDVATYLRNVEVAVDAAADELGPEGEVDLFSLSRRLGHRVGLASWGGPGAAEGSASRRSSGPSTSSTVQSPSSTPTRWPTSPRPRRPTERQGAGCDHLRNSGSGWNSVAISDDSARAVRPGGRRVGRCSTRRSGDGRLPRHHPHSRRVDVQSLRRVGMAPGRSHGASGGRRAGAPGRHGTRRDLRPRVDPHGATLHHGPLHARSRHFGSRAGSPGDPLGYDGGHAAATHEPECGARARPLGSRRGGTVGGSAHQMACRPPSS